MSILLALAVVARADPPVDDTPPTDPPEVLSKREARELARRLAELTPEAPGDGRSRGSRRAKRQAIEPASVQPARLSRVSVCQELVPKAPSLSEETLDALKATCPSWFPVPAPPTFCRIDPCVTDLKVEEGPDLTATAPR